MQCIATPSSPVAGAQQPRGSWFPSERPAKGAEDRLLPVGAAEAWETVPYAPALKIPLEFLF